MMAIYIALQEVPEPCNLYSDSSYVVNLLPHLPYAYIRLDANPISALMIQLGLLLEGRKNPYIFNISEDTKTSLASFPKGMLLQMLQLQGPVS